MAYLPIDNIVLERFRHSELYILKLLSRTGGMGSHVERLLIQKKYVFLILIFDFAISSFL